MLLLHSVGRGHWWACLHTHATHTHSKTHVLVRTLMSAGRRGVVHGDGVVGVAAEAAGSTPASLLAAGAGLLSK